MDADEHVRALQCNAPEFECRAVADPNAPLVLVEYVPTGGATPWGFNLFGPEGCFVAVPNQWAERLPDGQDDDGGMIGRGTT